MIIDKQIWKPSTDGWLNFIINSFIPLEFFDINNENIHIKINELIDRINENSFDSLISISKQLDFFQSIKYEYLRNNYVPHLMNKEKSFSIEQIHVNLAMMELHEQNKLSQIDHNDFIIDSVEHVYGNKININIKDMFGKCKEEIKKILVLGRAGIGKSTFCQYVAYRWAKGEIWSQYHLVILIRLRFLTHDRYPLGHLYSPIDLVEKEYFPYDIIPDEEKQYFKKLCDKGEVLWILDGYDEFIQNIPEQLYDVFNYLCKKQHHILTSRPYSISLSSYDILMKITGFTNANIFDYIQQYFDQIKDKQINILSEEQKLLTLLKSNPIIWSFVHIPINLEIICKLWLDIDKSTIKILNITELYDSVTEWLCRRFLTKQNINNINMDKNTVYTHCHKQLTFFESLAFHSMKDNNIILSSNLLEKVKIETNYSFDDYQQLIDIGILCLYNDKPIDVGIQTQDDDYYYFVYLSFQEYFAARYLVNILNSSSIQQGIQFIKNNKYNQRFLLVVTFTCGLLNENQYESSRNIFWKTILDEPLDLVGFRHIQLIIYCIDQVTIKPNVSQFADLISCICQWMKCIISVGYATVYDKLVYSLQRSIVLVQEPAIMDQLVELLQSSNSETKQNAYKIISALSICNPQTHLLSAVLIALDDDSPYIRADACLTLGKIGEKAAKKEVIYKLLHMLADKNDNVRRNVCTTLGDIGVKVVTNEMLNKLVHLLADENEDVKEHACKALGKLGEKAVTNEVIDKLIDALGDGNWNVRVNACKALHAIGGHKAMTKIISKLMEALENSNWKVKANAVKALEEIGESAATSEVMNKLVNVLGDENWNVREHACKALPKIGGHVAMTELISMLVEALDNEHWMVRANACIVLGSMGERVTTNEVITKLVNAFGDVNESVRKNASDALGKIEKKAPTVELINTLIKALEHENWMIRKNSCIVLGYIGEKVATTDVVNKLSELFRDDNVNVKWKACEALCKIGKKFVTAEVIDTLLNTLGDTNEDVKQIGCYALGEIGEKAARIEVINNLTKALDDGNENVRKSACQALGKMAKKVASNEIIDKLSELVEDVNWNVRASACETLGKIGEKAATDKVIDKLMKALDDGSWKVIQNACIALGKLCEKIVSNKMITKLVTILGHEIEDIRESACEALCKMGENDSTNEVVNQLVDRFVDENENIRSNACYILCEMIEKAAIPYVLNKLISALENESENVRGYVCKTFCEMGEYAATPEVITKLMDALIDENEYVRCNACEALGALGKKALTTEVIRKLANALEDERKKVKLSACKALAQMGEKAGTNEVVEGLLIQIDNKDLSIRNAANRALQKTCASSDIMVLLNSNVVSKLLSYLERGLLSHWESISPDIIMKVFIDTKSSIWLSIATLVTLRHGIGITITKDSIIVYDNKEPVHFNSIDQTLCEQLMNVLKEQAVRLGVTNMRTSKVKVPIDHKEIASYLPLAQQTYKKPSESSCICILL